MIVFVCIALVAGSIWDTPQTGIFAPLDQNEIACDDSGRIFLLDRESAQVLVYRDGARVTAFGREGEGPGEFRMPFAIWARADRVFVLDLGRGTMSEFEPDGSFVVARRLPVRSLDIVPVSTGFVYGTWRFSMDAESPITLNWIDSDMGDTETLGEWERGPQPNVEINASGGTPSVPFNPAHDDFQLVASRDGSRFAVSLPGAFEIRIFDGRSRQQVARVSQTRARVPFNDDWGRRRLKAANERNAGNAFKVSFQPEFPDYFPIVRSLEVTADNQIGVTFWSANPDRPERAVFDFSGAPSQSVIPETAWERVVALEDRGALISLFDKDEEEAKIALVPLDQVEAFLKDHPIEAEDAPRFVMIGG